MKSFRHAFRVAPFGLVRRAGYPLASALMAMVALALPNCSLERSTIGVDTKEWRCSAVVHDGTGSEIVVSNTDLEFTGPGGRVFGTWDNRSSDTTTAMARVQQEWHRYLRRRLDELAAAGDPRFDSPPYCLSQETLTRMDNNLPDSPAAEASTVEVEACLDSVSTCGNPTGVTPVLDVSPPGDVDFGSANVGTAAADRTLMLSNVGDGRLCLAPQLVDDPRGTDHLADFSLDPGTCRPSPASPDVMRRTIPILATGESCSIRLGFTPRGGGDRWAQLRLTSRDSAVAHGVGNAGVLRSVPNPACFNVASSVVGGRTCYTQYVRLINDGPGVVTLQSAEPFSDGGTWTRIYPDPTDPTIFPVRLAVGTDQSIGVMACEPVARDSAMAVNSNAAGGPFTVPLLRPASGCTP